MTEKEKKVDFSLYTNQWDCLLNVPFSEIIIIIIIIIIIGLLKQMHCSTTAKLQH